MKFFKFFQYAYLLFAIIFIYDVIKTYLESNTINYISLFLAVLALFMFFFRRRYFKKFDNKDNPK